MSVAEARATSVARTQRDGGRGMNVIEAHALGKCYGSTRALRDCTLAIPDGHVVALVGPNGAGKTTLLEPGGRSRGPDRR